MKVVLISTYELGRQPFGLASPAAWLRARGHDVTCSDLSVGSLPLREIREANLVGIYLPMHTATRLAIPVLQRVRELNPRAHLCGFGLYAPLSRERLKSVGVESIIGGEFESALASLADSLQPPPEISVAKLTFLKPDRVGLPVLARYPKLVLGDRKRRVGYTEATRGCKHRCRHCPVVPVYNGAFRVIPVEVVVADIEQLIGAGAEHVTFGDPDFFNGPGHARRIIEEMPARFPNLTYDVTIKVEHLLRHREMLPILRETGCLFVTTAVESLEDNVLTILDKGHTRADFFNLVAEAREVGLRLAPTFIPFTPWTTVSGYRDLLQTIAKLGLVGDVASVQLSLRLLITANSRLLELDEIQCLAGPFDDQALVHPWKHPDPRVDALCEQINQIVRSATTARSDRFQIFRQIWEATHAAPPPEDFDLTPRTIIPYMEEPWFC